MTRDKLLEVAAFYRATLVEMGIEVEKPTKGIDRLFGRVDREKVAVTSERWIYDRNEDGEIVLPPMLSQLQHALWMADIILAGLENGMSEGKAFRWLGFIQGIFWVQGIFSIPDLRCHSRSDEVPEE